MKTKTKTKTAPRISPGGKRKLRLKKESMALAGLLLQHKGAIDLFVSLVDDGWDERQAAMIAARWDVGVFDEHYLGDI